MACAYECLHRTPSTKRQRVRLRSGDVTRMTCVDTKRCARLIGEGDRSDELLARHPATGHRDEHVTSQTATLVFNNEA